MRRKYYLWPWMLAGLLALPMLCMALLSLLGRWSDSDFGNRLEGSVFFLGMAAIPLLAVFIRWLLSPGAPTPPDEPKN